MLPKKNFFFWGGGGFIVWPKQQKIACHPLWTSKSPHPEARTRKQLNLSINPALIHCRDLSALWSMLWNAVRNGYGTSGSIKLWHRNRFGIWYSVIACLTVKQAESHYRGLHTLKTFSGSKPLHKTECNDFVNLITPFTVANTKHINCLLHVLWSKEQRDHPVCYQHSVAKPACLMVLGMHQLKLAHLEKHHQC